MRRVHGLELLDDQSRVVVDVPADGDEGNSSVGGSNGGHVRPGEDGWLELRKSISLNFIVC